MGPLPFFFMSTHLIMLQVKGYGNKMTKREKLIPSADGIHKLHTIIWEPEGAIKAVVQISHGMIEYVDRYDGFARFLCDNGIAVIGNDHLGHGYTAANYSDLGYFCPEHKSATVVKDLHRVTKYAKTKYKGIPYFLLGHSMGSFMARRYLMTYGNELDGAIIVGTGGQKKIILMTGMVVSKILALVFGDRFRSEFVKKNSFMGYMDRIPNYRTANDWISRDTKVVDKYNADKFCTFDFTVNGYMTLFEVIDYIQNTEHEMKIPKELPLLFVSGEDDPVGGYGEWIKKIVSKYKSLGIRNINYKLYPHDRHEVLNELDKEQVYADILNWIKRNM